MGLAERAVREGRRIARFFSDRRASVSVDFVVSIPILLAVLVLTSEYGRILQTRMVLENAVADSVRYLSRMPLAADGASFDVAVVAVAEELIRSRINSDELAISAPAIGVAGDFQTVSLSAAAGVRSPALNLLINLSPTLGDEPLPSGGRYRDLEGLIVSSSDTVRHFGR